MVTKAGRLAAEPGPAKLGRGSRANGGLRHVWTRNAVQDVPDRHGCAGPVSPTAPGDTDHAATP
jgi:hypothetical protein